MHPIVEILEQQNFPFVRSGPNVARNHINVKCPFCNDDPSEHLGINCETGYWSCWRDRSHRGRKPHYLLQALLGWSYHRIDSLLGVSADPSGLTQAVTALQRPPSRISTSAQKSFYKWPDGAVRIEPRSWMMMYWNYLVRARGFDESSLQALIDAYDLRACRSDQDGWSTRILFPIYNTTHKLVAMTGRAIGHQTLRYKSTQQHEGMNIKHTLWRWETLCDDSILVLTEGPLDALKLDWYGRKYGVRGTCVFGSYCSFEQEQILRSLCSHQRIVVAFDQANLSGSLQTVNQLSGLQVRFSDIPASDLGACTPEQIEEWAEGLHEYFY